MITLSPLSDKEKIFRLWKENGLTCAADCGCLEARSGEAVLGYSLYTLTEEAITVYKIVTEDLSLTDGILRSTLHLAAERSITDAYYSGTETERLCKALGFVKSDAEKTLRIEKLFESCHCGNK